MIAAAAAAAAAASRGTIKTVKPDKGFGFIAVPGERDLFFHIKESVLPCFDESLVGRHVEFEMEEGRDGRMKATRVKLAE